MIITNPLSAIRDIIVDDVFKVSFSVIPDILQITQNPLSFIHGKGFEPHPIASAR